MSGTKRISTAKDCDAGLIDPNTDYPVNLPSVSGRPDPQWVRGNCPECGDDLVSNMYYIGGKGYLIAWECWSSLMENPTCAYRRFL
jgi:hypothetical protein